MVGKDGIPGTGGRCVAGIGHAVVVSARLGLVMAMAAVLVAAPAANAASARYASPTGSGTTCSQAAPCSVKQAIEGASTSDDIFVPGNLGDYSIGSEIKPVASGIHVHGTNGRPRLIDSASGALELQGSSTADDLYLEGPGTVLGLHAGDSANNVIVKATTGHACYLDGATLTNSVCWAGTSGDLAVETDGSNTFRNDTLIGGTEAALKAFGRTDGFGSPLTGLDTLVNVIARGGSGVDLEANSDGTATSTINVSYSNYDPAKTSLTGTGAPSMTTINNQGNNQSALPLFVDATGGDFHEAAGSPTINAGINNAANGSTDFDGDPRIMNARTDIGADEWPTLDRVTRLSGNDRIGTAIAISGDGFAGTGSAGAVVLARADTFPDALAGTPLAVAKHGPLLLTGSTALDPRTKAEIQRVLSSGKTVYLLGGAGALSTTIESQLTSLGYTTARFSGADRFETAVKIAHDGLGDPNTILESTGLNFADALAGGAAAAKVSGAVLLTNGSTQAAETATYLAAHPSDTRHALGGPAAAADPAASPIVGSDRYDTSKKVATTFFANPTVVGVASGEDAHFPDALGGGAHIGAKGGPLVLTQGTSLPSVVHNYLFNNAAVIASGYLYGGPAAVSDAVKTAIQNAISGVS
jgi:hypothetical protein